jgi:hypothetical protein
MLVQYFYMVTKKKNVLYTVFASASFLMVKHNSSFIIKSIPVFLGSYVNSIKGNYF